MMLSNKCAICGNDLEIIRYKPPGNISQLFYTQHCYGGRLSLSLAHYELVFDKDFQLISEWFSIDPDGANIKVRNNFLTKDAEIYLSNDDYAGRFWRYWGKDSIDSIKVPYYLGYNQVDKIKSYMVMV